MKHQSTIAVLNWIADSNTSFPIALHVLVSKLEFPKPRTKTLFQLRIGRIDMNTVDMPEAIAEGSDWEEQL